MCDFAKGIGLDAKTALVIVDLQNDFLHPRGAYGRAGQNSDAIAALTARILPLAEALRAHGGWIVSTQFTLVPGKGGAMDSTGAMRKALMQVLDRAIEHGASLQRDRRDLHLTGI